MRPDRPEGDQAGAWPGGPLSVPRAVVLGLLHGPAELLPVSSSAHIGLVARLLGWPLPAAPGERKAFAVALHGGTLAGMLVLVPLPAPRLAVLATLPAGLAGLLLERPVQERLGGVRATALGLVAGSALLVAADALGPSDRDAADAGTLDALVLGGAQALALMPGLSRLGLTVAAARARGFHREAAFALGRGVGLPVVAGATALKALRLRRVPASFAAGAAAALAGTLAAAPLARATAVRAPAAERVALAAAALWRG